MGKLAKGDLKVNTLLNYLIGGAIFALGDLIAQITNHDISLTRVLGIFLIASTLYALELDNYFKFLANWKSPKPFLSTLLWDSLGEGYKLNWLGRTIGAILFFNPLWIARHFLFIDLFRDNFRGLISCIHLNCPVDLLSLLNTSTKSFILGIPLAFIGNYVVQVKVPLKYRFIGSSILSLLFAIYYGIMEYLL